ncbi:MAG: SDR family oxidoreductase [Rhodobacteraceae bacterium]|nr:SDR family oxidoreductase [Paracoccaceae bacterium]MCY4139843.1 SDR family oxidoreductase [Paracoccaceae bacterium]
MARVLLSIGHGYTARALARIIMPDGWRVIGTTRSDESAGTLLSSGIDALVWPGSDLCDAIGQATHVLVSVPPGVEGDPVLQGERDQLLAHGKRLGWVGYLSTTGVYGDHGGGWVDESTPPSPSTERGRRRVQAEAAWAKTGLPVHVFRLAGIYGPGRGPFRKVLDGRARRVIKAGQVFSRIHVSDIARILKASMERPEPGTIYNVCDDEPAPPEDVIACAARLLGVPVPEAIPFDLAELSPMARSFYAESKRVSNRKVKAELGVTLEFPDFRSGLAALLQQADPG